MKTLYCLLLGFFLFIAAPNSQAAAPPSPTAQLKPTIDKVIALLRDERFLGLDEDQKFNEILVLVRERFNFHEMSKRVLGGEWRSLSTEQQDHFIELFTKLLQQAYIDKVEDYAKHEVSYKGERIKGDRAEVKTELVGKDLVIPVAYIMSTQNNEWMVYDIVVENISLVRNYMDQFREILHKKGYNGLIEQLQKKTEELSQKKKNQTVS